MRLRSGGVFCEMRIGMHFISLCQKVHRPNMHHTQTPCFNTSVCCWARKDPLLAVTAWRTITPCQREKKEKIVGICRPQLRPGYSFHFFKSIRRAISLLSRLTGLFLSWCRGNYMDGEAKQTELKSLINSSIQHQYTSFCMAFKAFFSLHTVLTAFLWASWITQQGCIWGLLNTT